MRLTDLTIERIETFAVALPTRRSFGVVGGAVAVAGRPSLRILVKVSADGVSGWGEATPIPAWTYETVESIVTTIDRYLAPAVTGRPAWDLDGATLAFERAINRGFSIGAPLAKSAVDVALHDLLGRAAGLSLGVLWGQRRGDRIDLGWIVSGQSPAEVADSVAEGRDLGYRAFKVKVGLHDEETDAVDVAIAKVQRSGGLTLSRRLCALAEDSGVRLMGSGLTDSDVGLAASLHLFAAYGIDTPVDLNGRQFIESPYAGPTVRIEAGTAHVPDGPGLGVEVDEAIVRELAVNVLETHV